MTPFEAAIFGVMGLLGLASLLPPVARRLRLPYTVLLALLGLGLGLIIGGGLQMHGLLADFVEALQAYRLDSDALLNLFLPALLFSAGLNIDVRRLMDDIGPVILLAVVAVIVCTGFVGLTLALTTSFGLVACLLLGSIVATTDAAAVVAIFRDLGAPRRLSIIVEGESLFNDAAAIALFSVLVAVMVQQAPPAAWAGVLIFLRGLLGGLVFGWLAARLFGMLIERMGDSAVTEITLTIALAYLTFVLAEVYLSVSGVIAVVTAAIVVGSDGRTRVSPDSWEVLRGTWRILDFVATSLVFILAAMLTPAVLMDLRLTDVYTLLILFAVTLLARIFVLYALSPLLSAFNLGAPIESRYKIMLVWGGLRGAVTVALALAVSERADMPDAVQCFVLVMATGYVLMTLFIQAPTLRPLMRLLRLNRLTPTERKMRDRVRALARRSVREQVLTLAESIGLESALRELGRVGARVQRAESPDMTADERLHVGLLTLASREGELVLDHYRRRLAGRRVVDMLRADAGRLLDGVKTAGTEGYLRAAVKAGAPDARFRAALWCQRTLGLNGPLARSLADRFEVLLAKEVILKELAEETVPSVAALVGAKCSERLKGIVCGRMESVHGAILAFELQYPAYAGVLRVRFLQRFALGLEEREYARQRGQSVIGADVYEDLEANRRQRRRALDRRPPLDLGLKLTAMLAKVAALRDADPADLKALGRQLSPVLAIPGERIISEGETGKRMYFIVTGEVDVERNGSVIRLGEGDFFGEIALLTSTPRTATVTAVTYCSLLELRHRDFRRFLTHHPELRARIQEAAKARMEA